jgi:cation diffusion facilitator CzcD-associated flavoprotein CzcO
MTQTPTAEHLDILIIGAGISGIDAAYHLARSRPGSKFAIIEAQSEIGGTWHTHRFPGIRSDSDLYTFGFKWKPWLGVPIATADEIMSYLSEAVDEQDLRRHIRFNQIVTDATWSSKAKRWTVTLNQNGHVKTIICKFLWMCAGYYRHSQGYVPDYPGVADFAGPVVHPQNWPEDLDYSDKSVVVIGSGATAATLIPAMSKDAAHVTMLQRSPTYFFPRPQSDEFTDTLRALDLPDAQFHDIMRRRNLHESEKMRIRSLEEPDALANDLINGVRAFLDNDYDIETHFTPTYKPWDQRLAMVPEGDFFQAISSGRASVVTGHIARFTKTGITLKDGQELKADIVISATGLLLNALGDIRFEIDDVPLELNNSFTHRGIMFSDVPNLVNVFGYLRSSWTLRADLVSDYVCRLLDHMEAHGLGSVIPRLRADETEMVARPWIEAENFSAGYIQRRMHLLPKQGDRDPWIMSQDYFKDRDTLPAADFEDGTLVFA